MQNYVCVTGCLNVGFSILQICNLVIVRCVIHMKLLFAVYSNECRTFSHCQHDVCNRLRNIACKIISIKMFSVEIPKCVRECGVRSAECLVRMNEYWMWYKI